MTEQHDQHDLAERYQNIWQTGRAALLHNEIAPDPLPTIGTPRWGLSTVFRPQLPPAIWRDLATLAELIGPQHTLYGPDNVHVTLRVNDNFRGDIASDDTDAMGFAEALRDALRDVGPLPVIFRGMIAVKTGILLCGYPQFDLQALRGAYLHQIERRHLLRPGQEMTVDQIRNTCHASLVMFNEPLRDPAGAVAWLDAHRHQAHGSMEIRSFEVVFYRRSWHRIDTITLVTIPHGADRGAD